VTPQSAFRERERSDSHKRGANLNRDRLSEKELNRILMNGMNGIENDVADDQEELDDQDYQRALELIYEKYKNQPDNNDYGLVAFAQVVHKSRILYIYYYLLLFVLISDNCFLKFPSGDQLLLRDLFNDEHREEDQDPRFVQIPLAERRNVNARYPLFNRDYKTYRDLSKRFPVSKRSARAMNSKRQVTDPKVRKLYLSLIIFPCTIPSAIFCDVFFFSSSSPSFFL
jgi:hypothetical protein